MSRMMRSYSCMSASFGAVQSSGRALRGGAGATVLPAKNATSSANVRVVVVRSDANKFTTRRSRLRPHATYTTIPQSGRVPRDRR